MKRCGCTFLVCFIIIFSLCTDSGQAEISGESNYGNIVVIDVNEKSLYVVSGDKVLKRFPVATGKEGTPSPLGDFKIIQKDKWGEGFGTSWLGLNVPWGRYGIHGTKHPESIGRSASGGCIRLNNRDIDELYKLVKVGTPVKIMGGPYDLMGNGYRELFPGDRGSHVIVVQKKLKEKGYYTGALDGVYGIAMERAVNKFQSVEHLSITNKIDSGLYRKLGIILYE